MRHKFIFGGLDSSTHDVWISGEGTYDSPERDVQRVAVPGRNGELIIDNGRWKNIEVSYPAFTPSGFDTSFPGFRAAICRKRGYQRLEDDYHPDEYRMASFINAIQPNAHFLNDSANFTLVFNCKPQRFLKSGDAPLQFMPIIALGPAEYSSRFMPIGGEDLEFKLHCPVGDTLTVTVYTYDSSSTQLSNTAYTCSNGDSQTQIFSASDKYFRVFVSGMSDLDETYLEVKADLTIGSIDAIMARAYTVKNPTGYEALPLIEVYSKELPNMTISNYEDGQRYEYYDFYSTETTATQLFMDCDMQYLYDSSKANLTSYLMLTTMHSDIGEGLVFPRLGTDKIELYMYYSTALASDGCGLVNIYPRWYTI